MQVQSGSSFGPMRQAMIKLGVVILSLTLLGCSGGVDEELRSYTEGVLKRKAKPLPPPDPPEPYLVYNYSGQGVDPFEPFFKEPAKTTYLTTMTASSRQLPGASKKRSRPILSTR